MHPTKEHPKHHSISLHFLVSIVEFETSPKKVDQKRKKVSSTNKKRQRTWKLSRWTSLRNPTPTPGRLPLPPRPTWKRPRPRLPRQFLRDRRFPLRRWKLQVATSEKSRFLPEGKGRPDIRHPQKKSDDSKEMTMTCLLQFWWSKGIRMNLQYMNLYNCLVIVWMNHSLNQIWFSILKLCSLFVAFPLIQVSHQKTTSFFPLYWLFTWDLAMVYSNPHITG